MTAAPVALALALVCALAAVGSAQEGTEYCTGTECGNWAEELANKPLTKYERSLVTVHVNHTDSGLVQRKSVFFPHVDEYSRMSLIGCTLWLWCCWCCM